MKKTRKSRVTRNGVTFSPEFGEVVSRLKGKEPELEAMAKRAIKKPAKEADKAKEAIRKRTKDYVALHREKARAAGQKALYVQIDGDLIEWIRHIAKMQDQSNAEVTEELLKAALARQDIEQPFTTNAKKKLTAHLIAWAESFNPTLCCRLPRYSMAKYGDVIENGRPMEARLKCSACNRQWELKFRCPPAGAMPGKVEKYEYDPPEKPPRKKTRKKK